MTGSGSQRGIPRSSRVQNLENPQHKEGWEQGRVGAQQILQRGALTLASQGCPHRPKGRAALAGLFSAPLLQKGAEDGQPGPLGPSRGMS